MNFTPTLALTINAPEASGFGSFLLFAYFCAYWAQTTSRNPWLWFFLGLFFAPITGLFLVAKNADDKGRAKDLGEFKQRLTGKQSESKED